ncbi:MAG: hypothetical protein ACPHVJ_03065 [Psychrobacter sp.]
MDDIAEVTEYISIRFSKSDGGGFGDHLLIEDSFNHIYLSVDDWQAIKDAGDKLIADNKDG